MIWIYILGERTGADIKIGLTSQPTIEHRRRQLDGEANGHTYVLLAGMLGTPTAEKYLKRYFAKHLATGKGSRTEYFHPEEELIEYILWLRTRHTVTTDESISADEILAEDPNYWYPGPGRRVSRPPPRGGLFPGLQEGREPLANTWWDFMPNPLASFQDYFTPPDIVRRAADAMGGIDLDAASHPLAYKLQREAGVIVGDYFTLSRSAMDNEWRGNVWLNPPYGENEVWFRRAREMLKNGQVGQLCWLSPVWAFNTAMALEIGLVLESSAAVILSPTPKFINPADKMKSGTNNPHAIFYWGERVQEFISAFADIGIPFRLAVMDSAGR